MKPRVALAVGAAGGQDEGPLQCMTYSWHNRYDALPSMRSTSSALSAFAGSADARIEIVRKVLSGATKAQRIGSTRPWLLKLVWMFFFFFFLRRLLQAGYKRAILATLLQSHIHMLATEDPEIRGEDTR